MVGKWVSICRYCTPPLPSSDARTDHNRCYKTKGYYKISYHIGSLCAIGLARHTRHIAAMNTIHSTIWYTKAVGPCRWESSGRQGLLNKVFPRFSQCSVLRRQCLHHRTHRVPHSLWAITRCKRIGLSRLRVIRLYLRGRADMHLRQ